MDPFELVDDDAVAWARRLKVFCAVDGRYDAILAARIANQVADGLAIGLGCTDVGRSLATLIPGKPKLELENFAAGIMNRARVYSGIMGMADIGFESYQILAVGDERTCPACAALNRKRFSVSEAAAAIREITDSEHYSLAIAVRTNLPPFCDGCRCDIVSC